MTRAEPGAEDALWAFAVELYATAGVAACCIELQDRAAADVNIVLWCCWHGRRGRTLSAAELHAAGAAVADWRRAAIEPLRTLRRGLSNGVDGVDAARVESCRQRLQQLEIDAERIELAALASRPSSAPATASAVAAEAAIGANLKRYFSVLRIDPKRAETALRTLLAGCRDVGVTSGR